MAIYISRVSRMSFAPGACTDMNQFDLLDSARMIGLFRSSYYAAVFNICIN